MTTAEEIDSMKKVSPDGEGEGEEGEEEPKQDPDKPEKFSYYL